MKKAVHFGAGNIGRGFLGQLYFQSGYHTTFIDVVEDVVNAINQRGGYPIRVVYPADGTAYLLTGAGILAQCSEADRQAAGRLIDWLLSDEAQLALASQGFYFLTTNPATLAYQSFPGKNIVLFRQFPRFTETEKHAFLDRWVKYIRFSSP